MKFRVSFRGRQSKVESYDCGHGFEPDMMFIRNGILYMFEDGILREIDLNKPIANLKIEIITTIPVYPQVREKTKVIGRDKLTKPLKSD